MIFIHNYRVYVLLLTTGGHNSLYNNSIGDAGAKAVAEALKTNSTLTTLS